MSDNIQTHEKTAEQSRAIKLPDCRNCSYWFLGCLHGRKEWKDKSISPNLRYVGQSGKEYPVHGELPAEEFPMLRMYCDAFDLDPSPERKGRVLY